MHLHVGLAGADAHRLGQGQLADRTPVDGYRGPFGVADDLDPPQVGLNRPQRLVEHRAILCDPRIACGPDGLGHVGLCVLP